MPAPPLKLFLSLTQKLQRAGEREACSLIMEESSGSVLRVTSWKGLLTHTRAPCNLKPSVLFNMRTLVCWREHNPLTGTNSTNRASLLKLDRKMVKGLVGHSPPGRTGEPPPRWFWKIAAAPLSLTAQFEAGSSNPAVAILPNQGPGVAPGAGTGDRHGLQSSPRA